MKVNANRNLTRQLSTKEQLFNSVKGQMCTYSGKYIDIANPKKEDFCLDDIARGLAFNCRFAGQVPQFYSIAEHSMLVEQLIARDQPRAYPLRLAGLLHDGQEAYLQDIIHPIKTAIGLGDYEATHDLFQNLIFEKFELGSYSLFKDAIKKYDMEALEIEWEYLFTKDVYEWELHLAIFPLRFSSPENAYRNFYDKVKDIASLNGLKI